MDEFFPYYIEEISDFHVRYLFREFGFHYIPCLDINGV